MTKSETKASVLLSVTVQKNKIAFYGPESGDHWLLLQKSGNQWLIQDWDE